MSILILFFTVIISAFLVDRFNVNEKILRLLLAFSGAYLLTVAFTHIIPDIFSGFNNNYLGYYVLGGFFLQLLIEYISGGAEHGHGHCEKSDHEHQHEEISFNFSPYALLIGISLHAFFEGIPFASQFHNHADLQHTLLLGIVIHKVPIAIVLMGLFLSANLSRVKAYGLILIFALAAPLGALIGGHIGQSLGIDLDYFYKIIMAILVGIFLHVSTTILFESDTSHRFNIYKLLIILVGVGVALISNTL